MKNQNNYETEFLALKAELNSFLFRLVSNRTLAEDLVHDTYLRVIDKLHTFREESSFKTWVFAIANNLAKNHLIKENRWREDAQQLNARLHIESEKMFNDMKAVYSSKPDAEFEVKEHISYCFNCMMKTLTLEQQICLWLKNIYNFKVAEIITITGLTEGKVKHALADARKNLIRIFDDKCAFVSKNGTCHQCTSLKGILNPEQDAQAQANKIRMVKEGASEDKNHLLELRVKLVKSIDPIEAPCHHLHTYFLESSPKWIKMALSKENG